MCVCKYIDLAQKFSKKRHPNGHWAWDLSHKFSGTYSKVSNKRPVWNKRTVWKISRNLRGILRNFSTLVDISYIS